MRLFTPQQRRDFRLRLQLITSLVAGWSSQGALDACEVQRYIDETLDEFDTVPAHRRWRQVLALRAARHGA